MELTHNIPQPINSFLGKVVFLLTGFLLFAIVVGSSENPTMANVAPTIDYMARDSMMINKIEKNLKEYESRIKK